MRLLPIAEGLALVLLISCSCCDRFLQIAWCSIHLCTHSAGSQEYEVGVGAVSSPSPLCQHPWLLPTESKSSFLSQSWSPETPGMFFLLQWRAFLYLSMMFLFLKRCTKWHNKRCIKNAYPNGSSGFSSEESEWHSALRSSSVLLGLGMCLPSLKKSPV